MLRLIAAIMAIIMLLSHAGLFPRFNKDTAIRCYDAVISTFGKLALAQPWLLGEREFSDMSGCYGEYSCDGAGLNGSDFIFGGVSVYERKIKLVAEKETFSGSAELKIMIGGVTKTCDFDKNGRFEGEFTLNGSSGVMVEYDDFTGKVTIISEKTE